MKSLRQHLSCNVFAGLFAVTVLFLLCPSKTHAQSSGQSVDVCDTEYVDSANDVEQTVCLSGDSNSLTGYTETDNNGYQLYGTALYVVEVTAQSQIYDGSAYGGGTLVSDSGMLYDGSYTATTVLASPQLNTTYTLLGLYDECYDPSGMDNYSNCYWVGAADGLSVQVDVTGSAPPETGYIGPKYVILSVDYAPPGSASTVAYGNTTTYGTSTTLMNSFSTSNMFSVSLSGSTSILGVGTKATGTKSNTTTQQQDSNSSEALLKSISITNTVYGPPADGLNHNYDQVAIWLNPLMNLSLAPGSAQDLGLAYDTDDPCLCMEVVYLTLQQLQNPSLITDPYTLQYLARSWAPNNADGSGPGLTNTDLADIAKADPYSNASYNSPVVQYSDGTCTTDGRFCQTQNQNIFYNSGHGTTVQLSSSNTATEGQGSTDTHQTMYSFDLSASGGFIGDFSVDVKGSTTVAWTNKWTSLTSLMTGQTSAATIAPPSPSYTGPQEFCIYADNVYGTYMFLPC